MLSALSAVQGARSMKLWCRDAQRDHFVKGELAFLAYTDGLETVFLPVGALPPRPMFMRPERMEWLRAKHSKELGP